MKCKPFGFMNWKSDKIIRKYVGELSEEIREPGSGVKQETGKEEPWIRENPLTSDLYSCMIDKEAIILQEMLFGSKSIDTRQNIIVVSGGKHIGKKCFAKKILRDCQESVHGEGQRVTLRNTKGTYRIPVMIKYESHWKDGGKPTLSELIMEAIGEKCVEIDNTRLRIQVKKRVDELLEMGRFLIYFDGKNWIGELEEELRGTLVHGKIVEGYDTKAKYRNLVVLTVDSDAELRESFLNECYYTVIRLEKLTEEEVKAYLREHIPNLLNLAEKEKRIMEILRYPEHLNMFKDLNDKDLIEGDEQNELKSDFEFYDYFLRLNIRKKLSETAKDKTAHKRIGANRNRENAVLEELKKYAFDLYQGEKKEGSDPSRYFSFSDFSEIGLLDNEGEFVFPLCGYYLAAQNITEQLEKNPLYEIPGCFLEDPLEMIPIWVGRMIKDVECLNHFCNHLNESGSCKLLLLAKIIKETGFNGPFKEKIYKVIFGGLEKDFYDISVLETLEELGDDGIDYLKLMYPMLADDYDDKISRDNIKKRLVYFLGIAHKGIIDKMLDEFMEKGTDLHLKYHIIRAAVENYGEESESTKLITKRLEQLEAYCAAANDPIIRSDFCVLYQKCKKKDWISPENAQLLMKELETKMMDQIYWVRAHAAGAVGRRRHTSSCTLLMDRIKEELCLIYNRKGDYRNSIKVISYSVEAVCELSENREVEPAAIICQLAELLDMEKLGDQDIEDAYSTIATGIEYMISPDPDKLPFNLGGRFRNHTINYQRVLLNAFRKLEVFLEENGEKIEKIREKRKKLEEIMAMGANMNMKEAEEPEKSSDTIKILQLSDLHYMGPNSDNNMLIRAVKKFKGIDILVITGDLKQFGENYDSTLVFLNDLIKEFEITPEDVFMVPGNHDCDNYDEKKEVISDIRAHMYDDKEYYRKNLDKLYQGFQAYESFLEEFYGKNKTEQGGIHNKLFLWKGRLHILSMNTTLLCDDNTEKNKLVDINELTMIEKRDDLPTLCIAHHELEQLYPDHENTVQGMFGELRVSAMFSGDIHQSKVGTIHINPHTIPNYVCGKLLGDTQDTWSERTVALYTIDMKNKELTPRSYKWEKNSLVQDNTFREKPGNLEEEWKLKPVKLL